MHESSLEVIRCVKCKSNLSLEVLQQKVEIEEGFLFCKKCKSRFPIILKIPILWNDFSAYLSPRRKLGGELLLKSQTKKMKSFVKKALSKVRKDIEDRTPVEKRWVRIYESNKESNFYSKIKKQLAGLPSDKMAIEHGCSIGTLTEFLAKKHEKVYGIDRSFYAIQEAKKQKRDNLDFFVADSLEHPFGKLKFGLLLGLNLLEIIEPKDFLHVISRQVKKGTILITDPYDYDRPNNSVRNPMDSKQIRKHLSDLGFHISSKTKKPSFIPWNLKLNPRAELQYKVDVVLATRH